MKKLVIAIITLLFCFAIDSNAQITNAPAFISNPNSITSCELNNATFDVTATDFDSLRWQIFSNNTWSDLADTGSVNGSATSTLIISNLTLAYNAAQFRCVAYGPIAPNAISNTATLTVLKVPAITSFTPSRTVCENDNCSFNVQSPGGSGLFTYQWQVDSGIGFVDVVNNFNYTGATTKTINIASCPANMNMFYYRCIVFGPCNSSDTSTAVFLKVNTYPSITSQPVSKTICEGSSTNLSVVSAGSSLSHQWLQEVNGVFVNVTGSAVFSAGGTNTLNITNPPLSLSNTRFICRISNTCGSPIFTDTVTLFIRTIPTSPTFAIADTAPCQGAPTSYAITPVLYADNYTWAISLSGATLNATDTSAIVNFNSSNSTSILTVSAENTCGTSAVTSISITPNPSYQTIQTFSTCSNDSILIDGIYYYADTTLTNTFNTTNGCDSTIINTLLFNPSYNIQNNLSLCAGDSAFVNGAWQFTDGTFTESYTTTNGCDSTITTTLTFNLGYYAYMQESICFGDSLLYDGVYYSTAGIYPFNYTSSTGCDSIVELSLSVNFLPIVSFALDTILCENGSPLDLTNYVSPIGGTWTGWGVIGNTFDPASSGAGSFEINYSYIDLNGCVGSSSDSITVDVCSGLYDNGIPNLTLYPNPASDILQLNGLQNQALVTIYDVAGKLVLQVEVDKNSNNSINTASLAPGFYHCRIQQNNQTAELSFIKK